MLVQCSSCRRIRKFGQWVKTSGAILTGSGVPVKYMLCDDCKGINGGCERLRKLERKFNVVYRFNSVLVICMALGAMLAGLIVLQRWANS